MKYGLRYGSTITATVMLYEIFLEETEMRDINVPLYLRMWHREFKLTLTREIYSLIQSEIYKFSSDKIIKKHEEDIKSNWKINDKKQYQADKQDYLTLVTFSSRLGKARGIKITDPKDHSGIINLDIDLNTKEELIEFFKIISSFPYVEACWRSISGIINGSLSCNVLIEIPKSYDALPKRLKVAFKNEKNWVEKLHKSFHYTIEQKLSEYKIKVGAANDLKRPRYLNYDPDIYINENAIPITLEEVKIIPESKKTNNRKEKKKKYKKFIKKILNAKTIFKLDCFLEKVTEDLGEIKENENRTKALVRFYGLCNTHGIPLEDALSYASKIGGEFLLKGYEVYEAYSDQYGQKIDLLTFGHIYKDLKIPEQASGTSFYLDS